MSARLDLAALRRSLAGRRGRVYWRCLEEAAQSPAFLEYVESEFPRFAAVASATFDRRRFLELMAASLGLGGLAGCGPEEAPRDRVAYVVEPEGLVPGSERAYSTATLHEGMAEGVLVTHTMGRPIKIEGNPAHPASLGATSATGQAAILTLYDPYRAQALSRGGDIASWEALATLVIERRSTLMARGGEGFRLLTGAVTSPTLTAQIGQLQRQFPAMRWHRWEPINRDEAYDAARQAFGRPLDLLPDFSKAQVILAIESDCISEAPGRLAHARAFAARRRAAEAKGGMSRLYALESTPTLFGAKADHRLILAPHEIDSALRILTAKLGAAPSDWATSPHREAATLDAIAKDLGGAKGHALVTVGREQPAAAHALAIVMNKALGAFGTTLAAIEPVDGGDDNLASLKTLTEDLNGGKVDTLIVIGTNPVFTAPADFEFASALKRARLSIALAEYADETASRCHWLVAQTHLFEAWSDARAFDGTATILQPQVMPLFGGRSPHELLALWLGDPQPDGAAIVRGTWQALVDQHGGGDNWNEMLRSGLVPESAAKPLTVAQKADFVRAIPPLAAEPRGLTLLFRPDLGVWDGRFAPNGWLLELARPLTRLTWDNAALVAPRTAERLNVREGDVVALSRDGKTIEAPVWILPGQAEDCVTLPMGFGRTHAGPVGTGVGFDAYRLRASDAPWQGAGATLARTKSHHTFAPVQYYAGTDGRDLLHEGTLAEFLENPDFLSHAPDKDSLYSGFEYPGIAWAMSINLNSCIGCAACVVACQAENNIPVVGKEEVLRQRDMQWLRIDRYYEGSIDSPTIVFQPVPCMHCENAPCEVVCPVQATVHDSQGLNVMVYNRCVGTRFCSNNCPYKVRRFNFFDYTGRDPRLRQSWNPEVTVRARGVMEKCTYCVQRTRAAMIAADRDNRPIRDGEVRTACQQACPTEAIVFGNQNDRASTVAARKASPLDYVMLEDLNTRPRTSYEAIIRNPNPGLGDDTG